MWCGVMWACRFDFKAWVKLHTRAYWKLNVAGSFFQVATRRQGTLKGGYVAKKEEGALELIILAAGSEVQHAVAAADALGKGVRVVSVPSMFRFDKQSAEYREEVLPASCTKRIAMEVRQAFRCCVSGILLFL